MAKKTKKTQNGLKVRFTLAEDVLELLNELAGPNASCVIKAMSPAFSGNPEAIKSRVGY